MLVQVRPPARDHAPARLALLTGVAALLATSSAGADGGPGRPEPTLAEAQALLPTVTACTSVPCLLEAGYAADPAARALALALWRDRGDVAGVGPREIMDGGYRGKITLVPQLPSGRYRTHLAWTSAALRSFDDFFARLYATRPGAAPPTPPAYRWRGLQLRFVRSVGKRTPSAYAFGWVVEYNVRGSLMVSAERVRETLFHELFHNNDVAHRGWSLRVLADDYAAIVARCGTRSSCLAPYAPGTTKVRATGTYYAFQPGNGDGVNEYGAELAVRYWQEQTEMLERGRLRRPAFKCGPVENARSWKALVDEFFAGRDLVPPCGAGAGAGRG